MSETKTVLVTGANKGIGRETAAQLGRRGFRVAVGSRDEGRGAESVAKLRAEGVDAFVVPLDVTSDQSVQAAAELLASKGGLDVLVNNAGINGGDFELPSEGSLARLQNVLETNVFGVIRVTNAMLPLLRRSSAPRIVNLSTSMASLTLQSTSAMGSGLIDLTYGPSKTLLNAVTLQYARELADTNILINAVCPGYVATDFTNFAGYRTIPEARAVAVQFATLPDDGRGPASSTTRARSRGERSEVGKSSDDPLFDVLGSRKHPGGRPLVSQPVQAIERCD